MQLCCTSMAYSICVLLFLNNWHPVEAAMNAIANSSTSLIEEHHMESHAFRELNIQICQVINGAEMWWYTNMLKCQNLIMIHEMLVIL